MRNILILSGRYLPGYKDGGPVRTIANIVDCLGDEYRFTILAIDRDHGDSQPYPDISYDAPNKIGKAEVFYVKEEDYTKEKIVALSEGKDLLYTLGVFSSFSLKAMLAKKENKIKAPVVIAPMGTLSVGAYRIKHFKKSIFVFLCKALGLYKNVSFSVTSSMEKEEVENVLGNGIRCYIAQDLPRPINEISNRHYDNPSKKIRIVFISRISKKKNLSYAIDILSRLKEDIQFSIFGTKEDNDYFEKCHQKLLSLPKNISWQYYGEIAPEKVVEEFSKNDIFLFPTKSENYGHVIAESLMGGCMPIISDQTPWNDLEKNHCGYSLSLDNTDAFIEHIRRYATLSDEEKKKIVQNAQNFVLKMNQESIKNTGYRKIFG